MGDLLGTGRIDPGLRERLGEQRITVGEAEALRDHQDGLERINKELADHLSRNDSKLDKTLRMSSETSTKVDQLVQDNETRDRQVKSLSRQLEDLTEPPEWAEELHEQRVKIMRMQALILATFTVGFFIYMVVSIVGWI